MTYNKKELGPVLTFILWLVGIAIICIIGISNVFAATYDATSYTAQLYDNYGPSLHTVTTDFTNMSWRGTIPSMTANTSGAAWGISSPIPLLANHTYSMTVKIEGTYGGNITLSTYNRIGVGTSLSSAKSSYENNTNSTLNYSNSIASNMSLQFAFTPSINSNYIVFPFATTYSGSNQSFYLYDVIIDDLGASSGVSETTINNSLNSQTNEINNSITNSENNIKNTIKDTEDNIIDSNKETQNVIKDQFNTCRDSYNIFNKNAVPIANGATKTILDTGVRSTITTAGTYRFFSINLGGSDLLGKTITIKSKMTPTAENKGAIVLYFGSSTYVSRTWFGELVSSGSLTKTLPSSFPENTDRLYILFYGNRSGIGNVGDYVDYTDLMIVIGDTVVDYEEYGEQICTNKLDEQNETSKGILGKIKDILSYINPFSENFFAYKLVELIINGLKSLIVPDDFDFINDFKDVLEAKLGFIASVPIQLLDYLISFKDKAFTPVTSITFPKITFFGYSFWNEMQIDISQGLGWISAFKYLTDFGCVVIMVNTLRKWYANFTGGDEK